MQTSPTDGNADDMGSLARLDSLDEYFMIHSPPESPQQDQRKFVAVAHNAQQLPQPQQQQTPNAFDSYGYYAGINEMATQGNVQMPTSNFSVDRSGSARKSSEQPNSNGLLPSTQRDIDELLKMDDKDLNLSELFLQTNHRSSINTNYQAKGALKGHDTELHKPRSNSFCSSSFFDETNSNNNTPKNDSTPNSQQQQLRNNHNNINGNDTKQQTAARNNDAWNNDTSLDDFDLDVDPTPLSEIRAKSEQRKFFREHQTRDSRQSHGSNNNNNRGFTSQELQHHEYKHNKQQHRLHHGSNYYPFGRSYQLPIPTMPPISPPQADAVATAAALASVQKTDDGGQQQQNSNNNNNHGPYQQPPQSPQQSQSGGSWHDNRPESRNSSNSHGSYHHQHQHHSQPHHQSHSPNSAVPQQPSQHPPPLPYPQQHQQHGPPAHHPQPPPYHQSHHPHTSGSPQPHRHLTTPLVAGPGVQRHGPKIIGPYTSAQRETNANNSTGGIRRRVSSVTSSGAASAPAPTPPASYLPRRGTHMPREAAAAHSTPKGVLADADKQRRGYSGFHKPATSQTTNTYHHPLPSKFPAYAPPTANKTSATPSTAPISAPVTSSGSQPASSKAPSPKPYANGALHQPHHAPPIVPPLNHPPASDNAYERKKQRAKDARVKLNESIERLHVSMGVAGTESKKRTEQLRNFMQQAGREQENTTDHQAFEMMDSCVKTAESAKKWDRPNFVGSAATMIQCLNSQCEILMKELLEYQETARLASPKRPGRPAPAATEPSDSAKNGESKDNEQQQQQPQDENVVASGKRAHSNSPSENPAEDTTEKRRRLNDVEEEKKEASSETPVGGNANPVSPESASMMPFYYPPSGGAIRLGDSIMDLIASFIDPGSLTQCMGVCKNWRKSSFGKNETWTNLCIKRFGFLNVRQWQEHQTGEDSGDENAMIQDNSQSGEECVEVKTGLKMYREMDDQCIMPWLRQDGMTQVLIGKGRLQNVSAWLFLVQRSNGETMRSVKRNPAVESSTPRSGLYSSLPVVELRIVLQNTGPRTLAGGKRDTSIIIKEQRLVVDASTRRRGEELKEIFWDDRFKKKLINADGSTYSLEASSKRSSDDLVHLNLFETVVVVAFIHARRCSTTTKFIQRSNFLKVLLLSGGTTQPLVIPFPSSEGDAERRISL